MTTSHDNTDQNVPVCWCGATEELVWGPNPYNWEILDDDTPEWLCPSCYQEASDEI